MDRLYEDHELLAAWNLLEDDSKVVLLREAIRIHPELYDAWERVVSK